jgi:protein PsiE
MFALARHISFEDVQGADSLYLAASIALLALALVALAYRDKLVNKKGPELPEVE